RAIADLFERLHDRTGRDFALAPPDRETAVREIEPRAGDARHRLETALDFRHAAGAMDALDRETHFAGPVGARRHKAGKIDCVGHDGISSTLNGYGYGSSSGTPARRSWPPRRRDRVAPARLLRAH